MNSKAACHKDVTGNALSCENNIGGDLPPITLNYRPRGSLARTLYEKQQNDYYLTHLDKMQWYKVKLEKLPKPLASKFVQLNPDEDTQNFVRQAEEKSDWIFTQIWHSIAKAFLGWFMSQTSINGWLRRGSMFVISTAQFLQLLNISENWKADSLLDLGAGDGKVTEKIAHFFRQTYVTEMSPTMRTLLEKNGYKLLEVDNWHHNKYDMIACLNLLDRCDEPLKIIQQMHDSLKPDGFILLAVVLPFSPYVEYGKKHMPKEVLPVTGSCFEEQVNSLTEDVLKPAGFDVVSWSRIPYLCEGDLRQSFYWLNDVVMVLKPIRHN